MDCIFSGLMNNSTINPSTFDLGAWGNTSSSFLDSLNLGGESVDGDGLFRDKKGQKSSELENLRCQWVPWGVTNISILPEESGSGNGSVGVGNIPIAARMAALHCDFSYLKSHLTLPQSPEGVQLGGSV